VIDLVVTHYPLHTGTPEEGVLLADLFRGRNVDLGAMQARMAGLMRAEGLEFVPRERTYNSRLAQELGKWADESGKFAIHDALFRAYFIDGINLAKVDPLVKVAESVGLDGAEARRVLEERTFRGAIDEDWKRARAIGVTGVPTFAAAGRGVVGAQPYEVLEQLVAQAGAVKREG
jgi:predicted DsbA family dithiol-disulfide isomerase